MVPNFSNQKGPFKKQKSFGQKLRSRTINDNNTIGASVVAASDGSKTLLSKDVDTVDNRFGR